MTLNELIQLIWKQEMAFANTAQRTALAVRRGERNLIPLAKVQKSFLDNYWSGIYQFLRKSLDDHGDPGPEAVGKTFGQIRITFHKEVYPKARNAGYPESSFLLKSAKPYGIDDIMADITSPVKKANKTMPWLGAESPLTHTAIGEDMDCQSDSFEKFANCCTVELCADPDGRVILHVKAHLRNPTTGEVYKLDRTVDLAPLITNIAKALAYYHSKLHDNQAEISGWRDWVNKAGSTAKRIAQSSAVKSLYREATPYLASVVPGGTTALKLATKAHDVIVKAREGDKVALTKVAAVRKMAQEGDPKAKFAFGQMRMINLALNKKDSTVVEAVEHDDSVSGTYLGGVLSIGFRVPRRFVPRQLLPKRKPGTKGFQPRKGTVDHRTGPARGAYQTPERCQPEEQLPTEEYGLDEAEVAGWLYNRPYRTSTETVLQSWKSPGIMLTLREIYNRGM